MALTESCRLYQSPKDGSAGCGAARAAEEEVVELNVGGQVYFTRRATLASVPDSALGRLFTREAARDARGRRFIDRDGFLFRYVLDYLRDGRVLLPERFPERARLRREAEFYRLHELAAMLATEDDETRDDGDGPDDGSPTSERTARDGDGGAFGFLTVSCRGARLCVRGRLALARRVFGDALVVSESRENRERYTARGHLLRFRHTERAFDMLAENGFRIVACSSSAVSDSRREDTERSAWSSSAEYVFYRGPSGWSSSHCECCCKSQKSEREGESGTSFNELSTSCSETQSEASSPHETVIVRPAPRQPNVQTLDRAMKKVPAQALQQAEMRRRTDLLRVRTHGPRDLMTAKRKAGKEKMTPEQELQKCIQDFRRIKIPERFPDRKNMWQSDLLRKYHL
ncbi:BTB/POZ domain-containing protein KCTD16-like [Hoplias malabaricus]|uniref:BTB/POZ domain-containing protein KCTD16-like n=1 Tax=Hoplias malabaricus TaxID=27720 RepID=UPI003461FCBC